MVDVDVGLQEAGDDRRVPAVGSPDEAGSVVAVERADIGAVRERELEEGRIVADFARRDEVGALNRVVLRVHVGACVDQLPRRVDVVGIRRGDELPVESWIRDHLVILTAAAGRGERGQGDEQAQADDSGSPVRRRACGWASKYTSRRRRSEMCVYRSVVPRSACPSIS